MRLNHPLSCLSMPPFSSVQRTAEVLACADECSKLPFLNRVPWASPPLCRKTGWSWLRVCHSSRRLLQCARFRHIFSHDWFLVPQAAEFRYANSRANIGGSLAWRSLGLIPCVAVLAGIQGRRGLTHARQEHPTFFVPSACTVPIPFSPTAYPASSSVCTIFGCPYQPIFPSSDV